MFKIKKQMIRCRVSQFCQRIDSRGGGGVYRICVSERLQLTGVHMLGCPEHNRRMIVLRLLAEDREEPDSRRSTDRYLCAGDEQHVDYSQLF